MPSSADNTGKDARSGTPHRRPAISRGRQWAVNRATTPASAEQHDFITSRVLSRNAPNGSLSFGLEEQSNTQLVPMSIRALARSLTIASVGLVAWTQAVPPFEIVSEGPLVEDRGVSRGAAWGDFDGDGDPDLFVARPTYADPAQRNLLYRNDGGRFTRLTGDWGPPGGWEGAAWVDVDGDGDLDLHVVGRNGAGSMFFENTNGRLTRRPSDPLGGRVESASMSCWADVDGDGRLDVFLVGYRNGRNALFRNLGSWQFEHVAMPELALGGGDSRACAWGDLDADGLPEMAVANAQAPNLLLRNRGTMRLEPDTSTELHANRSYSYGISWADVNGDGVRDLFIANFDAPNALYLGRAGARLEPVTLGDQLQSTASKGHAWGDFDLDGWIDVYIGSGTPGPGMHNALYLGQPDGGFRLSTDGEYAAHADTSAAIAGADYDRDGDIDLFVANWGSAGSVNRLYRNTAAARGWLTVRLEGVRSNRMGIGARASVLVQTDRGRRWIHRWLDASTGYAGQNEPMIHFGLSDARQVDSLVVVWPSGIVDRRGNLAARQTIRLREGSRDHTGG